MGTRHFVCFRVVKLVYSNHSEPAVYLRSRADCKCQCISPFFYSKWGNWRRCPSYTPTVIWFWNVTTLMDSYNYSSHLYINRSYKFDVVIVQYHSTVHRITFIHQRAETKYTCNDSLVFCKDVSFIFNVSVTKCKGSFQDRQQRKRGSIPRKGKRISSSPNPRNLLWNPPSLLLNGYRGRFPSSKAAGAWNRPINYI